MLWLKNLLNVPQGEFYYRQSEAGNQTFGPSPLIINVADQVRSFRRANRLPRAKGVEVLEDIVNYTVTRLVNADPNNEWTMQVPDQPALQLLSQAASNGGCAGCGAMLNS